MLCLLSNFQIEANLRDETMTNRTANERRQTQGRTEWRRVESKFSLWETHCCLTCNADRASSCNVQMNKPFIHAWRVHIGNDITFHKLLLRWSMTYINGLNMDNPNETCIYFQHRFSIWCFDPIEIRVVPLQELRRIACSIYRDCQVMAQSQSESGIPKRFYNAVH
jgi:hypothetical protein